jgi:tetratricopeptide (TPR) repeat protein
MNRSELTFEDYFESGNNKYSEGDYKGAVEDYSQAVKMNPEYHNAFNNRGASKEQLQDL